MKTFNSLLENSGVELSKAALVWLRDWQWDKKAPYPSKELIAEFAEKLRPKQMVPELYRFVRIEDISNERAKKLRSYTTRKELALGMAEAEEPMRGYCEVWYEVPPEKILVDFNMIPERYKTVIDDAMMNEVVVLGF